MDNEEIAYIKEYVTHGINMAQTAAFLASLENVPVYDSTFPVDHMEHILAATQDADAVCIIKDAYEAAYPRFQAMAIAAASLAQPGKELSVEAIRHLLANPELRGHVNRESSPVRFSLLDRTEDRTDSPEA